MMFKVKVLTCRSRITKFVLKIMAHFTSGLGLVLNFLKVLGHTWVPLGSPPGLKFSFKGHQRPCKKRGVSDFGLYLYREFAKTESGKSFVSSPKYPKDIQILQQANIQAFLDFRGFDLTRFIILSYFPPLQYPQFTQFWLSALTV